MPGGSTGGAQAAGRFYRNSSASLSGSLAQISLDTDSALCAPFMVLRNSGDIQTQVAGKAIAQVSIKASGVLLLSGVRIVMTRSPGTAREVAFVDCTRLAPTAGTFTVDASGTIDLDVDDTVRIEASVVGVGSLSLSVGGELNTWAHLIVG